MDDLLQEFLAETSESLGLLDGELIRLEETPNDAEILGNIFRVFHTIKGTCGFLNLPRLEKVAHAGEDLLSTFRDNAALVTPDAVSRILSCVDAIRDLLGGIDDAGSEPETDNDALIETLRAMAAAGEAATATGSEGGSDGGSEGGSDGTDECIFASLAEPSEPVGEAAGEAVAGCAGDAADSAPASQDDDDVRRPAAAATETAVTAAATADATAAAPAESSAGHEPAAANQSIRVNVDVLESLITLVSELVLTRNQFLQIFRAKDDGRSTDSFQRLSRITTELQEGVMKTRMQPVGTAWSKLPRIVRDLGIETGKRIELRMHGGETELDCQILEMIRDPLTHMVRNSADHGIETPAERRAAGKPDTGTIELNAFHEGGHIVIEIADNGRGLDTGRIRDKILERGLASAAELERLSDQQVQQFIFKPGFSTAETVTSVSGRGVGMDVVRTNVEKIGGVIELKSEPGRGSTFTIKIPLTLAIVSALIVGCADQRFAIPQICVSELVHVAPGGAHSVEMVNDAPVLSLRNRLLPLVSLHDLLKLGADKNADAAGENAGAADAAAGGNSGRPSARDYYVVVTQIGSRHLGLIVDRVFDTEEIVVKPVARMLRKIPFYSGTTILGDGSVIMILDPNGIATRIGHAAVASGEQTGKTARVDDRKASLIVFRAGERSRKAVPMALVERLENIDVAAIEHVNGRQVVQYRGHMMPLISLTPTCTTRAEGHQPVLVFSEGERTVGLIVDEILDIVEDRLDVEFPGDGGAIMGSAVIDGKATDLIDIGGCLSSAFADWFGIDAGEDAGADACFGLGEEPGAGSAAGERAGGAQATASDASAKKRVLLVDDSGFFLRLMAPKLSILGFEVLAAESGEQALELRGQGVEVDVIVSDIEMPGMNGFELAQAVHGDGPWSHVPIVALSSRLTRRNLERGRAAGFAEFVPKARRDELLGVLRHVLAKDGEAA